MAGLGMFAGPASALSINPEAGSPGIEDANTLHWIILAVIVVGIVVVNLALLRAFRPRTRHTDSGADPGSGNQLKVGIGLGVIALAIFVTATVFSDQSRVVPASAETVADVNENKQLEIVATGQQWLWRFNYPNGAFTFHRLVVPAGVTVALKLVSADVIHGWNVPSLTGKADAVPGRTNTVYFRADKEGVHTGVSSIFSGQGYSTMEARVEVVTPATYEAFVKRQALEIQEAQDSVLRTPNGPVTDKRPQARVKDRQEKVQVTAAAKDSVGTQ